MVAMPSIHLFNVDYAVVSDKLVGELEMEVSPLIINLLVSLRNQYSCLSPSVRTPNPAGEPLLPHNQYILRILKEAGVAYLCAFRSGQKGLTANIYAHCLVARRERFVRHTIAREAGIPFICRSSADSDGLDYTFHRAGKPEFKPTNVSDRQVFVVKFPACLFKGETVIPISSFETGEANFIPILRPTEKASIGFVKTFQCFLKDLRTNLFVFRKGNLEFRELLNLVKAGYGTVMRVVGYDALLKSRVVEITTKIKPMFGFMKSSVASQKTILKSFLPLHDYSLANFTKGVKQAFVPPPKGWVFSPTCGIIRKIAH